MIWIFYKVRFRKAMSLPQNIKGQCLTVNKVEPTRSLDKSALMDTSQKRTSSLMPNVYFPGVGNSASAMPCPLYQA